jgi:surfeit locus 1 family protein
MTNRGLVILTACTLAGLAILIGLGVWQLQRLAWKEGLIAEIETRAKGEPIPLQDAIAVARAGGDPSYYRVRVDGRFDNAKELYLYSVAAEQVGWHVITPLTASDGSVVLVDRGFVPDALRDPAKRAPGEIAGPLTVTGLARTPEIQGTFVPDNEVAANRWFWRDLAGMTQTLYPSGGPAVAPFFLEAEKSDVPGGWPEGGQTRLELPNNHLQYAITWFLLAGALIVIYLVFVRNAYRREGG